MKIYFDDEKLNVYQVSLAGYGFDAEGMIREESSFDFGSEQEQEQEKE